ncbi:MAG: amidohydrolase [Proteobacteria bacterium]|nr:amidohydrolase [Pseudomonadota bacterium]
MNPIEIRQTLHAHPELGFEEQWTSQFIANQLKALGLEVYEKIARTGVIGILQGQDHTHTIGYRADMDALPIAEDSALPYGSCNGNMHACGHDVHMAIALGIAQKLAQSEIKPAHDIVFVFQPNEEGAPGELPSGAELMCREGILERFHIEKMLALHCDPTLQTGIMGVSRGAVWAASGRFNIEIEGKSAHAAYPERGCDALWAASEMIGAMYAALKRRRSPAKEVVSVCKFHAGTAFNVIAENAQFEGISRGPSRKHLEEIAQIIEATVNGLAHASGVKAQCHFYYGANAVINDDSLAQKALSLWQKNAYEIDMSMASEDFSHFSEKIPSLYAMLGIQGNGKGTEPLHSSHFSVDESAIPNGIERMSELLRIL